MTTADILRGITADVQAMDVPEGLGPQVAMFEYAKELAAAARKLSSECEQVITADRQRGAHETANGWTFDIAETKEWQDWKDGPTRNDPENPSTLIDDVVDTIVDVEEWDEEIQAGARNAIGLLLELIPFRGRNMRVTFLRDVLRLNPTNYGVYTTRKKVKVTRRGT